MVWRLGVPLIGLVLVWLVGVLIMLRGNGLRFDIVSALVLATLPVAFWRLRGGQTVERFIEDLWLLNPVWYGLVSVLVNLNR